MNPEDAEVKAAGGVVRREDGKHRVVHRPRYDDWSLPKGKLDPGETWEEARCARCGRRPACAARSATSSRPTFYDDRKGRSKAVRYWLMEPSRTATFEPNEEVDELRWLPPAEAADDPHLRRTTSSWRRRSAVDEPRSLPRPARRLGAPRRRRRHARCVDSAIEAMADWMRSGARPTTAARSRPAHATDELVASTRAACATLLGGEPAGIVFGPTLHRDDDALRGDRRARRWSPGDEIVCTRLDHDSNVRPWVIAAERAGVDGHASPSRSRARWSCRRPPSRRC